MDVNNRGGPTGFVRVVTNDSTSGTVLAYPEYSGNRLYQSLGNLQVTPKAGLVFLNFATGDVLYVTGETKTLVGKEAEDLLLHTNLAVEIRVLAVFHIKQGLAFRGQAGPSSPYNPPVRYLRGEKGSTEPTNLQSGLTATLVGKTKITPSISRFRFQFDSPSRDQQWRSGQWVALSFKEELDMGYSHMRDEDPKSLNDDYLRTFTVSSAPHDSQFDITIRKVGIATDHLFRQNPRSGFEVPVIGFGGEFIIDQKPGRHITFIVGGIGITPLLPQLHTLDMTRFSLLWSINAQDIGLVSDVFKDFPALGEHSSIFVSGLKANHAGKVESLLKLCSKTLPRRIAKEDVDRERVFTTTDWYICTGPSLKLAVSDWLQGEAVFSESFNY
jgi:ferredoxin-NADP reductase